MKVSNFLQGYAIVTLFYGKDTTSILSFFYSLDMTLLQSVTQHFLFQNIVVFDLIVAFRVVERVVTTVAAIGLQLSAEEAFIAQSGNLSS